MIDTAEGTRPVTVASSADLRPVRVIATEAALALIAEITAQYGPVLFYQSGGCCDGSSPMCYKQSEFIIGERDVWLGEIGGSDFYISAAQFEYWHRTQVIVDVVPSIGGMFSLESGRGVRFFSRARIITDTEFAALERTARPRRPITRMQMESTT